jgi:hypothetical protein
VTVGAGLPAAGSSTCRTHLRTRSDTCCMPCRAVPCRAVLCAPVLHRIRRCAGVILLDTLLLSDRPKTCSLIKGDPSLGVFLRTVTRTDVTRLSRGSIPV